VEAEVKRPAARAGRPALKLVHSLPEPTTAPEPKLSRVCAATTFRPDEVQALDQIFEALMRGGTMRGMTGSDPRVQSLYAKVKRMKARIARLKAGQP
jgi:hypothetical protein